MNKRDTWQYHMIWYTYKRKAVLVDEVERRLVELINQLGNELCIILEKIEVMPDTLSLTVTSKEQLNITKMLKNMAGDLWDKEYIITTMNQNPSEADIRIEKILDHLWSAEYYDLDEGVTDDLDAFKKYLIHKNLGIVDYGERVFLIDTEALNQEINLNCFECTKIHKYGCCCGSPCDLSVKNRKNFIQHMPKIIEEMKSLDERYSKEIESLGGVLGEKGAIRECEGRCSLLVEHEGVWKCLAHKYALEQHIPIYDLCPLSCLMYPLEIIELITDKQKKIILLTSALDEDFAKEYGRWGSYKTLDVELRCIHKEAHNTIFKEKDYRPVYEVNKNLLIHEFGDEVYKGIEEIVN
ncbi:MAG: transposase [Candidatus Niameybacter stercoravium]|nr:transposase [Candidatus Niameybacter stercoravium]